MLAQSSLFAIVGSLFYAASRPRWSLPQPAEPSKTLELLRLREHCDSEVALLKEEVANLKLDIGALRKGLVDLADEKRADSWTVHLSTWAAWVVAAYLLGGVSFAPYLLRWFGSFAGGTSATAEVHIEDHRESVRSANATPSVHDNGESGLVPHRAPSEVGDRETPQSSGRVYVPRRLR